MPDWKSPATIERLLAAYVASNNNKASPPPTSRFPLPPLSHSPHLESLTTPSLTLTHSFPRPQVDNQAVARYMDETYDTIENRMRVYKREALKLTKEAEAAGRLEMDMRKRKDGTSASASASASPKKARGTPRKNKADLHGMWFPPSLFFAFL